MYFKKAALYVCVITLVAATCAGAEKFHPKMTSRDVAPHEMMVKPTEKPYRSDICINGKWDFQPVPVPAGYSKGAGAPELPMPEPDKWEKVKVKVPSPWNVNSYFKGDGGDYRTYPSYPQAWEGYEMGWLRKRFELPTDWKGKRIIIHFESVAGDCRVIVNGKDVGNYFDSCIPFSFDITDAVNWDGGNEVLVGVRNNQLFSIQGKYGQYPYPTGSMWLWHISGIWQDVFVMAVPDVRVDDLYVKPLVSDKTLEVEVTVRNDTDKVQKCSLGANIQPWINLAKKNNVYTAPEPLWKLGETVLTLDDECFEIQSGQTAKVILRKAVNGEMKLWDTENPNLYGITVQVSRDGKTIDSKYDRFGWREFTINDTRLLLNGEPIQMFGDSCHFMGIHQMSRRYAWAWYKMLRDAHGNAIRPHAMVYPRCYYDVADEMGILILDECAIYASGCNLNYEIPITWERYRKHVRNWIRRDRNHASIFGWSIINEVTGALMVKQPTVEFKNEVYDKVKGLADIVSELDTTRDWISGDGDFDIEGRLPVSIIHYGDPLHYKMYAEQGKPFGVGETGIAYYGKPYHSVVWNGERSYRSWTDRNDGVAREAWDTIAIYQRPYLAFCSIFNLGWYALKPLPLGHADRAKAPTADEGIYFEGYVEGLPGVQPERFGPYITTLNPGYDPDLGLYETWSVFEAVKAAQAPGGPKKCQWDHREIVTADDPPKIKDPIGKVAFAGDESGRLHSQLKALMVPFADDAERMIIIDGATVDGAGIDALKTRISKIIKNDGTVFIWGPTAEKLKIINQLLPYELELFDREASSLVTAADDARVTSIKLSELYFAEHPSHRTIMKQALGGKFVEKGTVLLEGCPMNWRDWNEPKAPLQSIAAAYRSELESVPGPALVELKQMFSPGRFIVSSIFTDEMTYDHNKIFRKLLTNLGVEFAQSQVASVGVFDSDFRLSKALFLGPFAGKDYAEVVDTDYLGGESTIRPEPGMTTANLKWDTCEASNSVFDFRAMDFQNYKDNSAIYLSFKIFSPRPLDELLEEPDVPKFDLMAGSDDGCKIWMNGKLIREDKDLHLLNPDQHRCLNLPLKKGWNNFLVKVYSNGGYWHFAARIQSDNDSYLYTIRAGL